LNTWLCNASNMRCEVAPKRTKVKPGGGRSRVATNSYREVRSDAALRLRVSVSPRLMTMTRRPDGQRKSSTRDTGCCR
jgi:hypothetical protein